jgi:hypothetical protein
MNILLADAQYVNYRYNRNRNPERIPEEWANCFPNWESLERIYQAEIALTLPVLNKLEDIAISHDTKWGMTENGFQIKLCNTAFCFVIVGEITEALKGTDVAINVHPASKTITVKAV